MIPISKNSVSRVKMKIVIAADSYKESLSAQEVCSAIREGMARILPSAEFDLVPIADGGEGTMDAISNVIGGDFQSVKVLNPINEEITANYLSLNENTCVIEIATACGLELISIDVRDPLITTSFGVGQLIQSALNSGKSKIIIALGSSATNDGGAGMLAALGARFYNDEAEQFIPTGGSLSQIEKLDLSGLDPRLNDCEIILACDVTAPLCGTTGASYVFARQKGAKMDDLAVLDAGLLHFSDMLEIQGGMAICNTPGAGAAGGIGASLMSLYGANIKSGIDVVLDAVNFEQHLTNCSLVITGEGQVDGQTDQGKAPIGVAKRAKAFDIPVILLSGALGAGYQAVYKHGIDAVYSATPAVMDFPTAMKQTPVNLANLAENVARLLQIQPI